MTEPFVRLRIGGLPKLLKKLSRRVMDKAILKGMKVGATSITGWIKEKRLTGPRPRYLGVVTGKLRSSITAGRAIRRGQRYLVNIGTNVVYAR